MGAPITLHCRDILTGILYTVRVKAQSCECVKALFFAKLNDEQAMTRRDVFASALTLALPSFSADLKPQANGRVRHKRVPGGGIQPQVVTDDRGVLHMLYYAGDPRHGTVFYVRSPDGGRTFATPLEVNAVGSAIAAGTIRGPQIAVGSAGRVHVAWNGSSDARLQGPINPDSGKPGAPMLYTRLNDAGNAFEPERNLMHRSFGLDGGGSVAADRDGNVYVVWHGIPVDLKTGSGPEGEARRQVWIARSKDDGATFVSEDKAWTQPTGACACCGMKAFASRKGSVHVLYRSATQAIHRDIYSITSNDHGISFQGGLLHKWEINACPMSSMDFAENPSTIIGAWETGGKVYWTSIDDRPESIEPTPAPGDAKGQKHPRLAINGKGEMLLVWTEGTGWQRGGSLCWQLYDRSGQAKAEKGSMPGVPAWSFAAPAANADGTFSIFY